MTLFIGGAKDGQQMEVPPDRSHVRIPVSTKPLSVTDLLSPASIATFEHQTYVRERIVGERDVFEVFVKDGMTGDGVMRELIGHYSPHAAVQVRIDEQTAKLRSENGHLKLALLTMELKLRVMLKNLGAGKN